MKTASLTNFARTYLEALKIEMENSKNKRFDKMRDGINLLDLPRFCCFFLLSKGFRRKESNPFFEYDELSNILNSLHVSLNS